MSLAERQRVDISAAHYPIILGIFMERVLEKTEMAGSPRIFTCSLVWLRSQWRAYNVKIEAEGHMVGMLMLETKMVWTKIDSSRHASGACRK